MYIIFLKACHIYQLLHKALCEYVGLNCVSLYVATRFLDSFMDFNGRCHLRSKTFDVIDPLFQKVHLTFSCFQCRFDTWPNFSPLRWNVYGGFCMFIKHTKFNSERHSESFTNFWLSPALPHADYSNFQHIVPNDWKTARLVRTRLVPVRKNNATRRLPVVCNVGISLFLVRRYRPRRKWKPKGGTFSFKYW